MKDAFFMNNDNLYNQVYNEASYYTLLKSILFLIG